MIGKVIEAVPERMFVLYYDELTERELTELRQKASMIGNGRRLWLPELTAIDRCIAKRTQDASTNDQGCLMEVIGDHMAKIRIGSRFVIEQYGHPGYKETRVVYPRSNSIKFKGLPYEGVKAIMVCTMNFRLRVTHYEVPRQGKEA